MVAGRMNQQRNKVRIIGGTLRRRMVTFPESTGLRPTPDRVRETVFNWLGQDLSGKRCLDLFAGSGAMGFEAASRQAAHVVMVEKSRAVAEVLKANRQALDINTVDVLCQDALQYLKSTRERFDVVFLDPPFDSELMQAVLPLLAALLEPEALVYVEGRVWPDVSGWQELKRDRAGLVRFGLIMAETEAGTE
jgi:16S rRNA (guanine966-N2)-methyltransferase